MPLFDASFGKCNVAHYFWFGLLFRHCKSLEFRTNDIANWNLGTTWSHLEPWYSSYTLHLPIQMYFLPDLEFSNLKVIDHRYISTFLTQACSSMLQLLTHVYLMFAEQVGVKLQLSPWFIFWERKICSGQQILRRWVWNANVKFMQQLYTSEWSKFMRATQQ